MPDIRTVKQRWNMDTIKTATYIRSRKKGRGLSPDHTAANDPSVLPGATAFGDTRLSRVIEDSLSDLTEAVSPGPSVTLDAETAAPAGSLWKRKQALRR